MGWFISNPDREKAMEKDEKELQEITNEYRAAYNEAKALRARGASPEELRKTASKLHGRDGSGLAKSSAYRDVADGNKPWM